VTKFEVLAKGKILQALKINYLQDFIVPGAGVAKWVSRQIFEIRLKFAKY
jgi:hypothetical protein